ncbi:MAG: hypothetical protein WCT37_05040 [Patescibacteria group bacterium]|jgi:SOS response regulatory protein OraA/RecX
MPERFQEDDNLDPGYPLDNLDQPVVGPKPHRLVLPLLITVAAGTLIMGFWQMGRNIKSPFELAGTPTDYAKLQQDSLAALSTVDTDGDGLSDYDEENIYGTSKYIRDTDSDGVTDGAEVQQGKDPLCREGQDCSFPEIGNAIKSSSLGLAASTLGNSVGNAIAEAGGGTVTAAELRQSLLDQGMDPAAVSQITDEQLLAEYQKALAGGTATTAPAAPTVTAARIRAELIKGGIDKAAVDQLTDEQLMTEFNKVMAEQTKTTTAATPTPAELRAALIQSGVDSKVVNQFTDAQLLAEYQKTVSGQTAGAVNLNTNSAGNTNAAAQKPPTKAEFLAAVEQMTGAQVKQLLKESGLDDKFLTQDDATLKAFLIEAVSKNYQ